MNGNTPAEAPGVRAFLETLHSCKVGGWLGGGGGGVGEIVGA